MGWSTAFTKSGGWFMRSGTEEDRHGTIYIWDRFGEDDVSSVGMNQRGQVVVKKRLTRPQLLHFTPP
jgi:hypothetical protein